MKRLIRLLGAGVFAGALAPACLYDGDQRCGPHQHVIANDRCECDDDYVPGAAGCVPCGMNERAQGEGCTCIEGYARAAADEACAPIPMELGAPCDTESNPCVGDQYALCHVTEGTSGYCTSACDAGSACEGGFKCHEDGSDSYCRRPPVGYGESCKSDDDCAGGEATFCETLQSKVCLVPCAAGRTDVCFEGEVCCNFVLFQPVCVPTDSCAPNGGQEVP